MTFPLLSDEGRTTIRAYGIEDAENGISWPAIFIVDKAGKVVWRTRANLPDSRHAGADPRSLAEVNVLRPRP